MSSQSDDTKEAAPPQEPPPEQRAKRGMRMRRWFGEKAGWYKLALIVLVLVVIAGTGGVAFYSYDYTENNPKFCVSCHLMQTAFDKWQAGPHKTVNCHTCHYATVFEKNMMLVRFIFFRPTELKSSHEKLLVPRDVCSACHWTPGGTGSKVKINRSPLHAKHVFTEEIECTQCHGTELHQFTPQPRFCVKCHGEKEVHGVGMEGLACLNCHVNQGGKDITPSRDKCMACHEGMKTKNAVTFPKAAKGAMQFNCSTCHHPHSKLKPTPDDCLKCHSAAAQIAKHKMHIDVAQKGCTTCHKPHKWRVEEADAKQVCVKCHEYRPVKAFF